MPILLWIIAGVLTLLGGAALWRGLRGRRLNDHPICRKCKFDLVGVYSPNNKDAGGTGVSPVQTNEDHPRCPECGRDLNRKRAVRHGERRRRPRFIIGGALLFLIGVSALGVATWKNASNFDVNTIKPEWLLMVQLHDASWRPNDAQFRELRRRLGAGSLSDGTLRKLAMEGLARQSTDRPLPNESGQHGRRVEEWKVEWGSIIVRAIRRGLLSDGAIIRFLSNAMFVTTSAHPTTPIGMPLRLNISYQTDLAGYHNNPPVVHAEFAFISVDGEIIARNVGAHNIRLWEHSGGFGTRLKVPFENIEPGLHRVGATIRYRFYDDCGGRYEPHEHATTPRVEWRETHVFDVHIQPAGTPEYDLIVRPEDRAAMHDGAAAQFDSIRVTEGHWSPQAKERLTLPPFPHPVCAEVILRCTEGDFVIQHLIFDSHTGGSFIPKGPEEFPTLDESVTIILRPKPELAERHLPLQAMWGEDIVLENVPVNRLTPAEVEAEQAERRRAIEELYRKKYEKESKGGGA